MANKVKHTHQYYRSPRGVWTCTGYDGCSHFIPSNYHGGVVGKRTKCNNCPREFVITEEDTFSDRPICEVCMTSRRSALKAKQRRELIEEFQILDWTLEKFNEIYKTDLTREEVGLPEEEKDEIEVIETEQDNRMDLSRAKSWDKHAPDCEVWTDGDCTCGWG
jgi:hypothetical protein